MRLQQRFITNLSLLAFVAFTVFAVVIAASITRFQDQLKQSSLLAQVQLTQQTLVGLFDGVNANLDIISKDSVLRRYFAADESIRYRLLYTEMNRMLTRFMYHNQLYYELAIILPDGYQDILISSSPYVTVDEYIRTIDLENVNPNDIFSTFHVKGDQTLYSIYYAIPETTGVLARSVNSVVGFAKISVDTAALAKSLSTDGFKVEIANSSELEIELENHLHVTRPIRDDVAVRVAVPNDYFSVLKHQLLIESLLLLFVSLVLLLLVVFLLLKHNVLTPLSLLSDLIESAKSSQEIITRTEGSESTEIRLLKSRFIELFNSTSKVTHKLRSQVYTDTLTGLPNRSALYKLLKMNLEYRPSASFAVLFLDLDGFKQVNDAYGHEVGDQLLIAVAKRLQGSTRATNNLNFEQLLGEREDRVIRLGGDEFTILLSGRENPEIVADRVISCFQQSFEVEDKMLYVGVSIGISLYPAHAKEPAKLIQYADLAMYEAKAEGKMRYVMFSDALQEAERRKMMIKNMVRQGVEYNRFTAFFQSKVDMKTGRLKGLEALARLYNDQGELVAPDQFISVAQHEGLLEYVTLAVTEATCKLLAEFGCEDLIASINIAPSQVNDMRLLADIRYILWQYKIKPQQIEFEVTEEELIVNAIEAQRNLRLLRDFGFRTALDDFGVGYSSLGHLRQFQFDSLKLDRIFVNTTDYDSATASGILRAIRELAQTLGMDVVAEGIETKEQAEFVMNQGIVLGQGYFYSKPVDHQSFLLQYKKIESDAQLAQRSIGHL